MARSKSTSGGKSNRATPNITKEHNISSSPANIPDVDGTTPAEAAAEGKVTPEATKLEVVKVEPRRNVVPINQAPANQAPTNRGSVNLEDEIRRRAYELYLQRGNSTGSEAEDWLTAEREVRQRYRQQQSA